MLFKYIINTLTNFRFQQKSILFLVLKIFLENFEYVEEIDKDYLQTFTQNKLCIVLKFKIVCAPFQYILHLTKFEFSRLDLVSNESYITNFN